MLSSPQSERMIQYVESKSGLIGPYEKHFNRSINEMNINKHVYKITSDF